MGVSRRRPSAASYFVVDVGRALRRHLLNDVDWVSIVPTHFLIVRAVGGVRCPQRDDDVTRFRSVVVGAADASAPTSLGTGERGQ